MQPEPIVRMNKSLKIVISNEQRKGASGEKQSRKVMEKTSALKLFQLFDHNICP